MSISLIIDWFNQQISEEDEIELFQYLFDTGQWVDFEDEVKEHMDWMLSEGKIG